jgi:gamma-glutamylcysteine synthetase
MEPRSLRACVAPLFARGVRRSTRVAVEHELITVDVRTGGAVAIDRVRTATAGAAYAPYLGFEPGGQVELSLPCASGPAEIDGALRAAVVALRSDCAAAGIRLEATPVDARAVEALPMQLTTPRYLAMQRHLDTIGPAGRRMMRATASTQVCLDWWPGAAGAEQWRLLLLAGPFLAAAFARSAGSHSRLATWLAVDPGRTAFDDRLLRGDDPVAAYVDLAAGATVFVGGGIEEHLTTLFPPVRPRGRYLEVRFLDVQPEPEVGPLVTVLTTLLYDDACRMRALAMVEPECARLAELWSAAADGDPAVVERGLALADLAGGTRVRAA